MKNIVDEQKFIEERTELLHFFEEQYHKPEETEVFYSLSNNFSLEVHHYYHEDGNVRHAYTKGMIYNKDRKIIDVIYRNLDPFIYSWIEINSNEYLLCGMDYQGYSIVDLGNGTTRHFVPEEAYKGKGFCWAEIFYFSDRNIIIVDGCYWACPYELVFFDFSNPLTLPYTEICRVEVDKITNWNNWKESRRIQYYDDDNLIRYIEI